MMEGNSGREEIILFKSIFSKEEIIEILLLWWKNTYQGISTAEEDFAFPQLLENKYEECCNYFLACYLANQSPDFLALMRNKTLIKNIDTTTKKIYLLICSPRASYSFNYMRDDILSKIKKRCQQLEENRGRR